MVFPHHSRDSNVLWLPYENQAPSFVAFQSSEHDSYVVGLRYDLLLNR